jgi:hypothetical protein
VAAGAILDAVLEIMTQPPWHYILFIYQTEQLFGECHRCLFGVNKTGLFCLLYIIKILCFSFEGINVVVGFC